MATFRVTVYKDSGFYRTTFHHSLKAAQIEAKYACHEMNTVEIRVEGKLFETYPNFDRMVQIETLFKKDLESFLAYVDLDIGHTITGKLEEWYQKNVPFHKCYHIDYVVCNLGEMVLEEHRRLKK